MKMESKIKWVLEQSGEATAFGRCGGSYIGVIRSTGEKVAVLWAWGSDPAHQHWELEFRGKKVDGMHSFKSAKAKVERLFVMESNDASSN